VVFDEITPDAPIPLIERGIECLSASTTATPSWPAAAARAMDAAKAIAVAVANPASALRELAGYLQGPALTPVPHLCRAHHRRHRLRGDGGRRHRRPRAHQQSWSSSTPRLVPKMAALDPALMTGLPPAITAATGIDALTHAIEAFIGNWKTPYSDGMALSAVGLIFENLRTACNDGKNLAARENMALASTYAGFAFTRANVGYVHAIAHQFGGLYHTPHGLANAIMLPLCAAVFRCRRSITSKLAELAVRARAWPR
jgi:alcohol dehydrogenase